VYVDECVYESERVSRLCTWCMWMSVCMNVIVSRLCTWCMWMSVCMKVIVSRLCTWCRPPWK